MGTLTVRNEAQRILFTEELAGQISDGMWENTRPNDHWEVWCRAEVVVGPNVGRDFYARKDNYNLNSSALLDCVGDRMLESVQAINPSYTMRDMILDLRDLKKIMKMRSVQSEMVTVPDRTFVLNEERHRATPWYGPTPNRSNMRLIGSTPSPRVPTPPVASVPVPVRSELSELVQ